MELLHELQAEESLQNRSSSGDREPRQSSLSSPAAGAPPPLASLAPAHQAEERPSNGGKPRISPAGPSRYRVAAAVLLVAAVVALAYVAWRSAHAEPEVSLPRPTPPVATKSSASPAQATGATRADTSDQILPASNQPAAPTSVAASTGNTEGTSTGPGNLAGNEPPATSPAETSPPVAAASGSEELSMAKGYLNGTGGKTRDTGEAVKWLWQAVAKKNAEAAGLLSVLYLRGEGVTKNCEQARILLDVAASKGVQEAAEQLRHLQDFGCE